MNTDKKLEYINMLDLLSEAFGESEEQSPVEIRKELQDEGLDIDSTEIDLFNFQQEISKTARRKVLDEAKIRRNSYFLKQKEIVDKFSNWTKEQLIDYFKNISNEDQGLILAYRDLKNKKDEDIKAILIDLELSRLPKEDDH